MHQRKARWVQEALHLSWDARTYHASVLCAFEFTLSCCFELHVSLTGKVYNVHVHIPALARSFMSR